MGPRSIICPGGPELLAASRLCAFSQNGYTSDQNRAVGELYESDVVCAWPPFAEVRVA